MMTEFPCVLTNADIPNVFKVRNQKGTKAGCPVVRLYDCDSAAWSHACSLAQLYWQNTAFIHRLSAQVTMTDPV